jgi:hypothetical protein
LLLLRHQTNVVDPFRVVVLKFYVPRRSWTVSGTRTCVFSVTTTVGTSV